ncbi:MAG: 3-deoxy-D-manno-octulosonic acid transferase [Bacteroidota bacterium]
MHLLYTFSIRLLYAVFWLAQFFKPKAKKWIEGRENKTYPSIPAGKTVIWFHCASLGEFDQGLPLMDLMKAKNPDIFLLVTFFSPSGFEHYNKRKHSVDYACYLPLDIPSKSRAFLQHFKPEQAFFVKYEFWSNFIFEAKRRGTQLYSVCTIFREDHRFFKWYGSFFRKTLRQIDYFFVQNRQSLDLLHSIGITRAAHVGDLRFDRVIAHKNNVQPDSVLERFISGQRCWVLGSSWSVDEAFLEAEIRAFEGKIILAPHDISEKHLLEIEGRFSGHTVRYTQFKGESKQIIILDCIGKLANAYAYGDFAYIGGGFTGSLHNILEPAVFGLPVIFGPKHKRFPEAQLFIDEGAGFCVSNSGELKSALDVITRKLPELQQKTTELVKANTGAAEKIYRFLEK